MSDAGFAIIFMLALVVGSGVVLYAVIRNS
jgi:hypothetical protein